MFQSKTKRLTSVPLSASAKLAIISISSEVSCSLIREVVALVTLLVLVLSPVEEADGIVEVKGDGSSGGVSNESSLIISPVNPNGWKERAKYLHYLSSYFLRLK